MIPQKFIDKLDSLHEYTDPHDCWIINKSDSRIEIKKDRFSISEIIYFKKYGLMIDKEYKICQSSRCANPNHIFDNEKDYIKAMVNNPNFYHKVWNEYVQDYCHIWNKYFNSNGYATIRINKRRLRLCREILILDGIDMTDLVTRHKCHNRACIKPEHLEPGTLADNTQDMVDANRQAKGENASSSKITTEKALEIIELLKNTTLGCTEIGNKTNVSPMIVSNIIRGQGWRHLSQMPKKSKRADWYKSDGKQLGFFD